MDRYHFLTSFGCVNQKQTEERGRFGAETKNISYPANVDKYCARNHPVAEEVAPEY